MSKENSYEQKLKEAGWEACNIFFPLKIGDMSQLSSQHLERIKAYERDTYGYEYVAVRTEEALKRGIDWGLHKENWGIDDPFHHREMYQVIRRELKSK